MRVGSMAVFLQLDLRDGPLSCYTAELGCLGASLWDYHTQLTIVNILRCFGNMTRAPSFRAEIGATLIHSLFVRGVPLVSVSNI